ncbi:MAG: hypothetical protein MJ180_05130 [Candidatus Gastranaerophilales bacterium]|nr:hypothetical protein [Candidatus Gastranaerophilales bacterium]
MNKEEELEFIKQMQETVEIMKQDDIEDNPDSEFEEFQCDCCAKIAPTAGSVLYGDKHFCNDCVLYAEIAFGLGKAKTADEIITMMEDKRLEELCNYIKSEEKRTLN